MGLTLSVGILDDLGEADSQGYRAFQQYFEAMNLALAAENLPSHNEPDKIEPENFISMDMLGYSGLHYLRRLAARVNYEGALPSPGDEDASKDDVLARYYEDSTDPAPRSRLFGMLKPKRPGSFDFDHLIQHSDCEGFYLPLQFVPVIFPDPELKIPGGMIGSSHKLLEECRRLAGLLQIPVDIDPESEELFEAIEKQGEGSGWKSYGIEAFTCIRLIHACEASLKSGAALVFA